MEFSKGGEISLISERFPTSLDLGGIYDLKCILEKKMIECNENNSKITEEINELMQKRDNINKKILDFDYNTTFNVIRFEIEKDIREVDQFIKKTEKRLTPIEQNV